MRNVHLIDVPASELAFHRPSGRVSLDLVATIGERWRRRFERLRSPEDLDRWCATVGLPVTRPATEMDLAAMRELRTGIETLAVAAMAGKAYPLAALRRLNEQARQPDLPVQLGDNAVVRLPGSAAAVRSTVARDACELFAGPTAGRIRECAADDCALMFVDTSRPGTRRWCSMRTCGNRTKVARHRRGDP